MCFVCLLNDNMPLFSKSIALLLSCNTVDGPRLYPCSDRKFWVQIICPSTSFIPISSDSVELHVLIFCFNNVLNVLPLPRVTVPLVCPRMFGWTAYNTSTHHLIVLNSSANNVSIRLIVPCIYLMSRTSFFQSSSLDFVTRVIKNTTATWISGCPRLLTKSSFTVMWWKFICLSLGSIGLPSST